MDHNNLILQTCIQIEEEKSNYEIKDIQIHEICERILAMKIIKELINTLEGVSE